MRTIYLLISIILIGVSGVHGQSINYDLTDYKLPTLKRQALRLDFDLHGNNSWEDNIDEEDEWDNSKEFEARNYFNIDYNRYVNNETKQYRTDAVLDIRYRYINDRNEDYSSFKNHNLQLSTSVERIHRFYFVPNQYFYEIDPFVKYRLYLDDWLNTYDYEETDDKRRNNNTIYTALPLKIGWGRIEEVQYARQALYILNGLQRQDRLSQIPAEDGITEIAHRLSKLEQKRYFDHRIRTIREVQSVDSLLSSNGYVSQSDAAYFTTLNDYLRNANGPIRKSGKRLSLAIIPGYYLDNLEESYEHAEYIYDKDRYWKSFVLHGGVQFVHEKPINLKWQNSIKLNAFTGFETGRYERADSTENIHFGNTQAQLSHTIAYYPNTRTEMDVTTTLQYVKLFDRKDLSHFRHDMDKFNGAIDFSMYYYISPRFRLGLSADLRYRWKNEMEETRINHALKSPYNPISYERYWGEFRNHWEFRYSLNLSYRFF